MAGRTESFLWASLLLVLSGAGIAVLGKRWHDGPAWIGLVWLAGTALTLKPVIASYSGESFSLARSYLTEDVLDVLAKIACAPQRHSEIDERAVAELTEMHVLSERGDFVTLDAQLGNDRFGAVYGRC